MNQYFTPELYSIMPEVVASAGGGKSGQKKPPRPGEDKHSDKIDEASRESFPSSDPPAWTKTTTK